MYRFLVACIFCLFITFGWSAKSIICPTAAAVRVTSGWAMTAQGSAIDWDGSLYKDDHPVGTLQTMDVSYAAWLDGYVVRCRYDNGELSNVAPIQGVCQPRGIIQNCQNEKCVVSCVTTEAHGREQSAHLRSTTKKA